MNDDKVEEAKYAAKKLFIHCVKSVRIRSFSGPYFPAFGLNTDQKNFEYGQFSRSVSNIINFLFFRN